MTGIETIVVFSTVSTIINTVVIYINSKCITKVVNEFGHK